MELVASNIEKSFRKNGSVTHVLSDVSFSVPAGSITSVYGPSGCGKSTLLRIVSGLDTDYDGEIRLNGHRVSGPTSDIGLTVQTIASYDWLSVARNITFGLRYSCQPNANSWLRRLFGRVNPQLTRSFHSRQAVN